MTFIGTSCLAFIVIYALQITWVIWQWCRTPISTINPGDQPTTRFSIVIPVKNEAQNIKALIDSILVQSYPKEMFELIIIDDHSSDNTVSLIKAYPSVRIKELKASPNKANKKKAITLGVESAKFQQIISTDGDCIWSENLLAALDKKISLSKADVISGIVRFKNTSGWLNDFERLDMSGMMMVTAAGIKSQFFHLANGAFLSYRSDDFKTIEPYKHNSHIASGDDMYLVSEFKKANKRFAFLRSKDALVTTLGVGNIKQFVAQRKRWAGKSLKIDSIGLKFASGIPFMASLSWVILLILALLFNDYKLLVIATCILVTIDFILLKTTEKEMSVNIPSWKMPILTIIHKLYILIFGAYALFFARPDQSWE